MKKQIIERIARELLNEARRFRATVRTAQPSIRSEAKANGAELAFEVEFKVRPGLSKLPVESEIIDEVAKSIEENTTVGLSSEYADGNYYYILSPIKTDKTRVYLYNVYIFMKKYVWKGFKETESDESGYVDKRAKLLRSPTVSAIPGAIYVGNSILYNSATWPAASQQQLKMYQPYPKAFSFINKVVNNQVDIVPSIDDKKVGEPKKTATATDNGTSTMATPSDTSSGIQTPISQTDPTVIDAVKNATNTTNVPIEKTSTTNNQPKLKSKDTTKQQVKLKNQNTIKNETAELINLAGKLIPNGNKIKPGTVVNVVKNSGDYVQVSFPPKPLTTLPENSIVRVKPAVANLKKIKVWNGSEPIINQMDQLITKAKPSPNGYRLIDKLPDPIKFIRIENKKALIKSDGIQVWVLSDILESNKSPVWILKKDIK